jgi:hypothetical protein
MPADNWHTIIESVRHTLVMQTVAPMAMEEEKSEGAKFEPLIVRLEPPLVAPLGLLT